jgi:hypothetical protein
MFFKETNKAKYYQISEYKDYMLLVTLLLQCTLMILKDTKVF